MGLDGKFFFGGATIEDLRRAPEAVLNILCRPGHCRGAFEKMEKRFGSNCVTTEQASSTEMTKRWLRAIGQRLGLEGKVEALIEREMASIAPQVEHYRKRLEGKTVAIHAVHDYTVPLLWLVAVDLGMIPTYVGVRYFDACLQVGMREIQEHLGRTDLEVVVNATKFEDEVIVSQVVKPDVYIGNLDYIPNMFAYVQPTVLMNGYHHVGPHMGFSGVIQLAREIVWAIENPFARKVAPYAGLRPYSSQAWLENSPLLEGMTLENIIG